LDEFQGLEIIENVLSVVATWRTRAKAMHISMADVEEMDHLFITELA
jgi:hypothetical protein